MIEIISIKYSDTFFKVDLDTGESLKVAPEIYNMYSLSTGNIIDNTLYNQLKEESLRFTCKQKALDYLAVRSRSRQEMKNYLLKKSFPGDIIEETLKGLVDSGYINDLDYAVNFINNKKKFKVMGGNALKSELFKKGINRDLIKKAIRETGADIVDIEDIYKIAVKKMESLADKKNKVIKTVYFLKQRGFTEDEIRTVIERFNKEGDALP